MKNLLFIQADNDVDLNVIPYLHTHMHTVNTRAASGRKADVMEG